MSETDINVRVGGFLQSALEKFIVSDYNEAIRDLKAAEVLDKENPEILYNLGINYSRLGLFKTALIYFERIVSLPYTFVEILTVKKLMAYCLINIGEYRMAETYLNQVIDLSSDDMAAMSMKGYCYERTSNYYKAVEIYKSIINIDKNNNNAYNSIAYILAKGSKTVDEALKYAMVAYESNRNNPAYMDTLGYVYMKKGMFDEAGKLFEEARKFLPLDEDIKNHTQELIRLKSGK